MPARYDCFDSKVVAIVGGAQGIGRACALMFAEQRAKVAVVDIKEDIDAELRNAVARTAGSLRHIRADALRPEEMARVSSIIEEEGPLKVLVNAIGGFSSTKPALELTAGEWDRGILLNLSSVFYSCSEMAKLMVSNGGGAIVNISSIGGRYYSGSTTPYYSAAKAGVEGLTRSLAGDLGRYGIRVNAVAPGTTATERVRRIYTPEQLAERGKVTARGKLAEPEEIAASVLFLASDEAVHITGTALFVNGGQAIFA